MYWRKILLQRHFALSWKTFHKPNILIQHCNKWEIGTSLFLFSSSKSRYPSFLNSKITQLRSKITYLRTSDLPYPFLILPNYKNREIEAGTNIHLKKKIRNEPQRTAKAIHLLPYLRPNIPQEFSVFGNSFSQNWLHSLKHEVSPGHCYGQYPFHW